MYQALKYPLSNQQAILSLESIFILIIIILQLYTHKFKKVNPKI